MLQDVTFTHCFTTGIGAGSPSNKSLAVNQFFRMSIIFLFIFRLLTSWIISKRRALLVQASITNSFKAPSDRLAEWYLIQSHEALQHKFSTFEACSDMSDRNKSKSLKQKIWLHIIYFQVQLSQIIILHSQPKYLHFLNFAVKINCNLVRKYKSYKTTSSFTWFMRVSL